WLAAQFGAPIDAARYEQAIEALRDPQRWEMLTQQDWFQEAQRLAREYRFFHWELEFPEVFFNPDGLKPRSERGFDIVMGNPPYVSVRTGQIREEYNRILRQRWSLARGQWDLFALMVEAGLTRVRENGMLSMVMPRRALTNENFEPLRRLVMEQHTLQKVLNAGTVFPEAKVEAAVLCLQKRSPNPEGAIEIYDLVEEIGVYRRSVPLRLIREMPFLIVPYQFPVEAIELATRLRTIDSVQPLGEIVDITRGIEAGMNDPAISKQQTRRSQPLVAGEDVQRYRVIHSGYYVEPDPEQLSKFKSPNVYAPPKLLTRFVAVEPITAYDSVGYYNTNVLYNLRLKPEQPYSLHYLCALLNSRLIGWWFRLTFQSEEDIYPHIQKSQLEQIPIRTIDFRLSDSERAERLQTALQLLEAYLEEPSPDYAAFLESPLGVWAQERLQGGESVALHDLLAHLAEQMHTLSLQIHQEKRGFLKWLYSELGVRDPDALDDRADIEDYDELPLEELLEILRRNHRRDKLTRSLRPRETRELIQTEYERSLARLNPFKRQREAIDALIDYLVYRLYGMDAVEARSVQ
ncbi:MAG: Eco57I restriction-modification methylase domain-containing protein, partial [Fimbriimonadales bacterium]|nr:Eco57I restriction-modification methylase domain-containing protein [Fimbriimonadales bacterium]